MSVEMTCLLGIQNEIQAVCQCLPVYYSILDPQSLKLHNRKEFCEKLFKKTEFYFQSNSVMNSLKCPNLKSLSHCPTESFPIYQNKHWTIRTAG